MKIKQFLFPGFFGLLISIVSCTKTATSNNNNNNTGNDQTVHSNDESRVSSGTDDMADDANAIIDNVASFNGRPTNAAFLPLPCNADFTLDSTPTLRRLTVVFHGSNCYGTTTRTGQLVLTMPLVQHWGEQGAVLTTEAQALKITRLVDGKSITINGTYTITNVTGGFLYQLATSGPIIHQLASNGITVTFDNGSQQNWQMARRRTFSYNNGIVVTVTGTHTESGHTDISEWGTDRFGGAFTTRITQPLAVRQDCNFRLVSGEVLNTGTWGTIISTFGLDATGTAVTTCPTGFFYFKAVWTGTNGATGSIIYPY